MNKANMRFLEGQLSRLMGAAAWVAVVTTSWGNTDSRPPFEEVSGLVRSNLVGATAQEIDWLAVEGLLSELSPRVVLVDKASDTDAVSLAGPAIKQAQIFRNNIGYIQFGTIGPGASEAVGLAYGGLDATNRLSGLVLDLRDVTGDDYAAALEVANLFLMQEVPLLNWGDGLKSSHPKEDAIIVPVAVLVNGNTGGSAEALAGMLRQSGVALLFGERTSGTAGVKRDFPLSTGQILKITVSNVQLGDARLISVDGLKPDVEVDVSAALLAAKAGTADRLIASGDGSNATNSTSPKRLRMDEADLVRRWRGEMLSESDLEMPPLVDGPERHDPVLVRALDLMDGLAILRSWQN
jgi:hypothetical protein